VSTEVCNDCDNKEISKAVESLYSECGCLLKLCCAGLQPDDDILMRIYHIPALLNI